MSFSPLSFGSEGAAVTSLQQSLILLRLLLAENALEELVTATLGNKTQEALYALQNANSIPPTGNFDYATSEVLRRALLTIDPHDCGSLVVGAVTWPNGNAASGLKVAISVREIRDESGLGEVETSRHGRYLFRYHLSEETPADIVIRIIDAGGKVLYEPALASILFDAPQLAIVSIQLAEGDTTVISQYEKIQAILKPLLKGVSFQDLQEDAKVQDITFLSNTSKISADSIAQLSIAFKLETQYKVPHIISYALFGENSLTTINVNGAAGPRFSIDLSTPLQPLFYDMVLLSDSVITAAVNRAVTIDFIVPKSAQDRLTDALNIFHSHLADAQKYVSEQRSQVILTQLENFATFSKVSAISEVLGQNVFGNFGSLLQNIQTAMGSGQSSTSSEGTSTAAPNVTASNLLGSDQTIIDAVKKLQGIQSSEDVHKLARLSQKNWEDILSKVAADKSINPDILGPDLIPLHASALARRLEKEFPTSAFVGAMQSDNKAFPGSREDLLKFFEENPNFDLARTNIERVFSKTGLAKAPTVSTRPTDNTGIKPHLKAVQRIFKLAPTYRQTVKLLDSGVSAAAHIHALGQTQFVNLATSLPQNAAFTQEEAKDVFQKASDIHIASGLLASQARAQSGALRIAALSSESQVKSIKAVTENFPNLQSLFSFGDYSSCSDCNSVTSPAAYLVDVLEWIKQRTVTDTSGLTPVPDKSPISVLWDRRKDIFDIDLNCNNTNTSIPYIDVVCEVLEQEVSPGPKHSFTGTVVSGLVNTANPNLLATLQSQGWPFTPAAVVYDADGHGNRVVRDVNVVCKMVAVPPKSTNPSTWTIYQLPQTFYTAAQAAAAPEYTDLNAYSTLLSSTFAFQLPFDLFHQEAGGYFNQFSISRGDLMRLLQINNAPLPEQIAAEDLGFSETERTLITTAAVSAAAQDVIWNLPNALSQLIVVQVFLNKTLLTFSDFEALLALTWLNPSNTIFVQYLKNDTNLSDMQIQNLDYPALDRFHRFIRVMRKESNWSITAIDQLIRATRLGKNLLDNNCLIILDQVNKLQAKLSQLTFDQLVACFDVIPTTGGDSSAYNLIYLNKTAVGTPNSDFQPNNVANNEQKEKASPGSGAKLSAYTSYIAICLGISVPDATLLIGNIPAPAILSASNLSSLYAFSIISSALTLKVSDLLIIVSLTGINLLSSPSAALDFCEKLVKVRASGLSPADLQYYLTYQAVDLQTRIYPDSSILTLLQSLQTAFSAAQAVDIAPLDPNANADENENALKKLLGKLPSFAVASDLALFQTILENTWLNTTTTPSAFIDQTLEPYIDTTGVQTAWTALSSTNSSTPAQIVEADRQALISIVYTEISSYLYAQDKFTAVSNLVFKQFNIPQTTGLILLQSAQLGSRTLQNILEDDSLAPLPSTTGTPVPLPSISPSAFDSQYRAVRLIYMMSQFITAMNLNATIVQWIFANSGKLGWLTLDGLPYESSVPTLTFQSWESIQDIQTFAANFPAVQNPADLQNPFTIYGLFSNTLATPAPSATSIFGYLAQLTGWDSGVLNDLNTQFTYSLKDLQRPATYLRLNKTVTILRRLGASVSTGLQLTAPQLTETDSLLMRQLLKARYSDSDWLGVLKTVQDPLRRQKRDALVAYILATNSTTISSKDDLYDYYLIDTQMGSCMMTSRIVQAHATVQLFVQRMLMGLEPKAVPDLVNDTSWPQWSSWMLQYRLWQANRLVFLFPENWTEPSLRDDKSEIFVNWENALQQNSLTDDSMETAAAQYLSDLDDIASMDVRCAYYDVDELVQHVFSRTKGGDPRDYYYRQFQQERTWTSWQKVSLDIKGDHLLAFKRNSRLCLAWPTFTQTPDSNATFPVPTTSSGGSTSTPTSQWQIQLAVSERSGNIWKKKTVSQDVLLYPPDGSFISDLPDADSFLFFVWSIGSNQAINVFYGDQFIGAFNLTGCKGYPEATAVDTVPNVTILPVFANSTLQAECFVYNGFDNPRFKLTGLEIRSIFDALNFDPILGKVVGNWIVTYPLQMSLLDWVIVILEIYLKSQTDIRRESQVILPLGTAMPYFYGDTAHTFVIIPGLYEASKDSSPTTPIATFSDIYTLLENIILLLSKYLSLYQQDPTHNLQNLLKQLTQDPKYIAIVAELKTWIVSQPGLQFKTFYHPLICSLRTAFNTNGFPALMQRTLQLTNTGFDFDTTYSPVKPPVVPPLPQEVLDFDQDGAYSSYNWELFFHLPFETGVLLNQNQQFSDAMKWYNYVFNPVGTADGSATPNKYWITKPFYLQNDYFDELINTIMADIGSDPGGTIFPNLKQAVVDWRSKPYEPFLVARSRTVAFQITLVLHYVKNLLDWGDNLFTQFTRETITQATQLYILADKLLGPAPATVTPAVVPPPMTFNQLEAKVDLFGNALLDFENLIPDLNLLPHKGAELPPSPMTLQSLYFCVPPNTNMMTYYTTVADRLFKIRNCQNINGIVTPLALFSPPIDPGALVRAAAAGISASDLISGLNAPLPIYRFTTMIQKAKEFTQQLNNFGGALLQALERQDVEATAQLQSSQQLLVLAAMTTVKNDAIAEGQGLISNLVSERQVIQDRHDYYQNQVYMNSWEIAAAQLAQTSISNENAISVAQALAAELLLVPSFTVGAEGFGGSPAGEITLGGSMFGGAAQAFASALASSNAVVDKNAALATTQGAFQRRQDEWTFQVGQATDELAANTQQQTTAGLHVTMLQDDLVAHQAQITSQQLQDNFLHSKFTNEALYTWMVGQLSTVYKSAYNLALGMAMKAERCFRLEIGNSSSPPFIQYNYWDNLRNGLLAGNGLINDINTLESAYQDQNIREYELSKQLALSQLDPQALLQLKRSGSCYFQVPEAVFDTDHPGQFMRRHKTVSLSIPCVAGPYTTVGCTLTLLNNKYRNSNTPLYQNQYQETVGNDPRFTYNVGNVQSISTSTAQEDGGLFELNFRDERYLPFEGTGCIALWQIQLPSKFRQFDYNTITDAILRIRYTARDGGSSFLTTVQGVQEDALNKMLLYAGQKGLYQGYNMRQQFPNEWWTLLSTGSVGITIALQQLPFFVAANTPVIDTVTWFVTPPTNSTATPTLAVNGTAISLNSSTILGNGVLQGVGPVVTIGTAFTVTATNMASLGDVSLLIHYNLTTQ